MSGPIPPQLTSLAELSFLLLDRNNLTGPLPAPFGDSLILLGASENQLSGAIPGTLGGSNGGPLYLDLSSNLFNGSIPPTWPEDLSLLNLAENDLTGRIPPELGAFSDLILVSLSGNQLSGTIPPTLGNLTFLQGLNLADNNLTGPIPPELGKLTRLRYLTLSGNQLSGTLPPALGGLNRLTYLAAGRNNLSGPFPGGFGQLGNLSIADFRDGGAFKALPLWARNVSRLAALGVGRAANVTPGGLLDLTFLTPSCQYASYSAPVSDIRFWEGCSGGHGCVVDLIGTGSRLGRRAKRTICLGKISVLLEGARVGPLAKTVDVQGVRGGELQAIGFGNKYRDFSFDDPDFVDKIDLGPGGVAYTGVGFTRVQRGNLCGNPNSKEVTAALFGGFLGALLVATVGVRGAFWWRNKRRAAGRAKEAKRGRGRSLAVGLYVWGIVRCALPFVDLYTDVRVLAEVWGAWPMWPLLGCIVAPFVVAGFFVAAAGTVPTCGPSFRWVWPPPEPATRPVGAPPGRAFLWAVVLWPVGVLLVLLQDALAVIGRFGFHLVTNGTVLSLEEYSDARGMLEMVLEAVPQAGFQTGLYLLGSSRATRIYIDQEIFLQSIGLSLLSVLVQYCVTLWEACEKQWTVWAAFVACFGGLRGPVPVGLSEEGEALAKECVHFVEDKSGLLV
jgi:hypothetical protein